MKSAKKKAHEWALEVECTGNGWNNSPLYPCHTRMFLMSNNVVARVETNHDGFIELRYGFTCPICKCFSEVDCHKIPQTVLKHAPRLAYPGSAEYNLLSPKQQEYCDEYFENH